jgi:hypothetical protein
MSEWRKEYVFWFYLWMVLLIPVPAICLLIPGLHVGVAIGIAAAALVAAIVVTAVQHHRAHTSYWRMYAHARGLTLDDSRPWVSAGVPLLRKGDERRMDRVLTGRIGSGNAALAQYTYTEVWHDDNGRHEEDHDFTLVVFRLSAEVAARYKGVYLREQGLSFGGLQDKLQHDRKVELESSEFEKEYELRVVDGQDDIALYELFSTTFIDQLTTRHIEWEQVGPDLVVYQQGHTSTSDDVDDLCGKAAWVYQRYSEEHR